MEITPLPYWRLSFFYLCYFSLLGAIIPFWGLYLDALGFSVGEIGSLMAVLMGTRIVAPNIWGWLADRTGKRLLIVRVGALLTLLVFSLAFWVQSFWPMAALMFGFTFFWNAVLPQFEVITLHALGAQAGRYSRIRLWGSVGFISAVVALGFLFDRVSITWLVPLCWGGMLLIFLSTLIMPGQPSVARNLRGDRILQILRRKEVACFFLLTFLIQLSHGPYYTFYSIYMGELGYDRSDIGLLWALGVVAEVLVFLIMHRLLTWVGLRRLMLLGLLVCALRWLLIGAFADQLLIVLIAQVLHAVTFGCLHAVGISLVQQFFPAGAQGQGQALYSSFGFGVGGALGAYGSGLIWSVAGGGLVFAVASALALVGWLLAWKWLRLHPVS